jgi:colicin import membrane protein
MMRWGVALALVLASQVAGAQSAPPAVQTDPAAQRERIAHTRAHDAAQFDTAQDACYQRFAVNRCLADVAVRRRAAEDALRSQEQALNQAQRMERAAQRVRSQEDKLRARHARDAQDAAVLASEDVSSHTTADASARRALPAKPLPAQP